MIGTYEVSQATGARSRIVTAAETDWGVVNASPNWKYLNVIAGEGLDENIAIYRSNVIRRDRMMNQSQRGSTRPGGALPFELAPMGVSQLMYHLLHRKTSTTGAGPYVHVLKGDDGTAGVPRGFTIEKGFLDLPTPEYAGILGARVASMSLAFNVDAMATGSFQILGRQWYSSTTSLVGASTPDDLTADPFTSVQCSMSVYESSSSVLLGTAKTLSLNIDNHYTGDNNVLGSRYLANLKPGTREITASGTFIFDSRYLYDKAVNGTATKLQMTVWNGTYGFDFLLPNFEFVPNNSSPKINRDGGLDIDLGGMAAKSTSDATDIIVTITSPEADITN